jgi:outer membrane receptor protein involved in Fe transport
VLLLQTIENIYSSTASISKKWSLTVLTQYTMMKKILLVVALLVNVSLLTKAQNYSGGAKASITGVVMDAQVKRPVEYASIALISQKDNSVKGGGISAADGLFEISDVDMGMYYAVVNFVGYQKDTIKGIKATPKMLNVHLDTIWLEQATSQLEAVDIVAERTYVEYEIDRKVVNVGKDLNASGGTAVEALENVPSVNVDVDGNVSLRGSSNFQVLINGKPTPLSGSDALEQIPVSTIKSIEIITNPSAKYDPDGMTGIINVVLKENVISGISGMIEGSLGTNEKYKLNGIVSYRNKKMNAFIGGNYRSDYRPGTGHSELTSNFSDTAFHRDTDLDRHRTRSNYSIKGGIDYYLNKKNTIGIEGSFNNNSFDKDFSSSIHEYTTPGTTDLYKNSINTGGRGGPRYSISSHWDHDFKKEGTNLVTTVYFAQSNDHDLDENYEYYSVFDFSTNDSLISGLTTEELEFENDFRFKSDFVRKIGEKGKFEAGIQARIELDENNFNVSEYIEDNDAWLNQDSMSAYMKFSRNIYSAYGTYGNEYKKLGYQIGLRAEMTDRYTEDKQGDRFEVNRIDLFPTVHLSRRLKAKQQVMLSYSRRVRRPGGWELSPFPTYINSNFIRTGNPNLLPEFVSNFDLSYQKMVGRSFVSVEGYYRTAKDKITRLNTVDQYGMSYMTYDNLERDIATGIELMGNFNITKWLNYTLSGNVYYYELIGESDIQSYNNSSTNYNIRNNLTLRIGSFSRLQLTAFYMGPSATATGTMQAFWMSNATYAVELMKRKVSVSLRVRDIFQTGRHAMETFGPNFYTFNEFRREGRVFYLTASYKINNYKQKRSSSGSMDNGGGDDIF